MAATLVMEEGIVHLVIGDEQIHQAILIVIRHCDSHSFARMGADPRFFRNIAEGPIAIVQKQLVSGRLVEFRVAVIQLARRRLAGWLRFRVPCQVVHHQQVEQAIVVDVDPGCSPPTTTGRTAGRAR